MRIAPPLQNSSVVIVDAGNRNFSGFLTELDELLLDQGYKLQFSGLSGRLINDCRRKYVGLFESIDSYIRRHSVTNLSVFLILTKRNDNSLETMLIQHRVNIVKIAISTMSTMST